MTRSRFCFLYLFKSSSCRLDSKSLVFLFIVAGFDVGKDSVIHLWSKEARIRGAVCFNYFSQSSNDDVIVKTREESLF